MPDGTLKKILKKPWKNLEKKHFQKKPRKNHENAWKTGKNTKNGLENLEKTLKNAPKIAGNPGYIVKIPER